VYESIDHVGIIVADIAQAATWYEENLGWKLRHKEYVSDAGAFLGFLLPDGIANDADATSIQLVQPTEPGHLLDYLDTHGEGLHHLCLSVSDISVALGQLSEDPDGIFMGGRGRLACFLESTPDGVRIELAGPVASMQASVGVAGDTAELILDNQMGPTSEG